MDDARIAQLLAPFLSDGPTEEGHEGAGRAADATALSPAQLLCISTYIDLLQRWNARINLTAVREPEEIVSRHFGESFFAARHLFPKQRAGTMPMGPGRRSPVSEPHLIDVGSGAGFPGLPIKIWAPQVIVTLIESNQKKATFLRDLVRRLGLTGVDVFAQRASAFEGSKGDVVTLRAVERFESILPVAAGLVRSRGCLAIMVGEAQLRTVGELVSGFQWREPARLPLSDHRVLIIGSHEPQELA